MYRGQVLEGTALDRSGSRWAGVDGSTRDARKSLGPSAFLAVETTREARQVRVRDIFLQQIMLLGGRKATPAIFDFLLSFQSFPRHVSSDSAANESGGSGSSFDISQRSRSVVLWEGRKKQEAVGRSPAHWLLASSPVIAGRALLMGGNLVANRGSQNLQDSRHSP